MGRHRADARVADPPSELAFREEVSIIVMRGDDGQTATYPVSHNVHDAGILVESVAPASIDPESLRRGSPTSASGWPWRWA